MSFANLFGGEPQAAPPVESAVPQQTAQTPDSGGFFQKMRSDPALAQAMLMAGVRMMQGPQRGQNVGGMIGDAIAVGAATYGGQKHADQQAALEGREQTRREAATQSTIAAQGVQTDEAKQRMGQSRELFADTKARLAEEVKRLRAAGRHEEAQALISEWKADPTRLQTADDQEARLNKARIGQANASAGAAVANAEESRAGAKLKTAQAENPEKFRGNPAGGKRDQMDSLAAYYKQAFRDLPEPEIAKKVLDHSLSMKGEEMQILRELANSLDPKVAKDAQRKLAAMVGLGDEPPQKAAPTPAKPQLAGGLPALKDRVKGTKYNGFTWTGTGWIKDGEK